MDPYHLPAPQLPHPWEAISPFTALNTPTRQEVPIPELVAWLRAQGHIIQIAPALMHPPRRRGIQQPVYPQRYMARSAPHPQGQATPQVHPSMIYHPTPPSTLNYTHHPSFTSSDNVPARRQHYPLHTPLYPVALPRTPAPAGARQHTLNDGAAPNVTDADEAARRPGESEDKYWARRLQPVAEFNRRIDGDGAGASGARGRQVWEYAGEYWVAAERI